MNHRGGGKPGKSKAAEKVGRRYKDRSGIGGGREFE